MSASGLAQPFAGSFVPLSESFFTGGGDSLRGFPLDGAGPQRKCLRLQLRPGCADCPQINVPSGGNELLVINAESRIPLPIKKGLSIVPFYDGGNVFPEIGFHDFTSLYSNNVGIGLRYSTPVGPIRIDVGHNLNPVPGVKFNTILHHHRSGILRRAAMDQGTPSSAPSEGRQWLSDRRLLAIVKALAAFIVLPIAIGAIALSAFINSSGVHAYLLRLIQQKATESLGVDVRLQNFSVHPSSLSVDLYGLTVDGAGSHPTPPLLQVQHAEAGVRIVSVFGRKWYFDSIRIDNPVAQIFVDRNGVSNLPTFKKSGHSSNTTIFDLGIRHAVLANGVVLYNNRPSALAVDLRDVQFDATFNSLSQ